MPQAFESRRRSPPRGADEPPPRERGPLDAEASQLMVERLYTPDLVRRRRQTAEQQAALERQAADYDSVRDIHLANYWSRQRHLKATLRCFAKNAPPKRATTPGPWGTVHSTALHSPAGQPQDHTVSGNAPRPTGGEGANGSGSRLPPLKPIQELTPAGSPARRSETGPASPEAGHAESSRTSSLAASSRASSVATTPASSPRRSPRDDDASSPPRGGGAASPPSPVASPSVAATTPEKRRDHAESDDGGYASDFASEEASPTKKEEQAQEEAGGGQGTPGSAASPASAAVTSRELVPTAPDDAHDHGRAPTDDDDEGAASSSPPAPAPAAAVPFTDADAAVLCMLVAPAQHFAAAVRRLQIHDGIDLAWAARGCAAPPLTVTLLDIPLKPPPRGHSPSAAPSGKQSARPSPSMKSAEPTDSQTEPHDAAGPPQPTAASSGHGDGGAAPDPSVEDHAIATNDTAAAGETAQRPQTTTSATDRRSPYRGGINHHQNRALTSPRSALVVLRRGVRALDLWPVPRDEFFRVSVNEGVPRMVLKHRYDSYENGRRALLTELQNEYAAMCGTTTSAEVLARVREHSADGARHDPAAAEARSRWWRRKQPAANGASGGTSRSSTSAADNVSPYAADQRITPNGSVVSTPAAGPARPGSHRASSVGAAGATATASASGHPPAGGGPRSQLTAAELHLVRQQRLRDQFERMVGIEQRKAHRVLEQHRDELAHAEALRQQREAEAEARRERTAQRDQRIERAKQAATQLAETKLGRHEALMNYTDDRSQRAIEVHAVERLAQTEYQRQLRRERLRMVAAHERQREFEKLCTLNEAQRREADVNAMLHHREQERRRMREERQRQAAELRDASAKLNEELLRLKRRGLAATA